MILTNILLGLIIVTLLAIDYVYDRRGIKELEILVREIQAVRKEIQLLREE